MAKPILTQEIVRSLLDYDPETGIFTWQHRDRKYFPSDRAQKIWNTRYAGKKVGALRGDGYIITKILGRMYTAHRLVFLYMTGSFPAMDIDHIDRNKSNNRFENLRTVSNAVNHQNRTDPFLNNKTKILGVYRRNKRFSATISVNGKNHHLGTFPTAEQAGAAYLAAKQRLHPDAIQAVDTAKISC